VWLWPAAALATPGLSLPFAATAFAQDATSNAAPEDDAALDTSRDQWRERVVEARRRTQQFALEHDRGRIKRRTPAVVLNDDSLQREDIVPTNKGLFLFMGQSDQERCESDFMAVSPR
jgi:hypothetical protein